MATCTLGRMCHSLRVTSLSRCDVDLSTAVIILLGAIQGGCGESRDVLVCTWLWQACSFCSSTFSLVQNVQEGWGPEKLAMKQEGQTYFMGGHAHVLGGDPWTCYQAFLFRCGTTEISILRGKSPFMRSAILILSPPTKPAARPAALRQGDIYFPYCCTVLCLSA
eukprot:1155473-Pelagomonas_calceolata.AAC.1